MTDDELLEEAQKRGFFAAATIKPAHILGGSTDVEVPIGAFLEPCNGDLYFRHKGSWNLPDTNGSGVSWMGIVYSKAGGNWAEIVTSRTPMLRDFPARGVCWEPTTELLQYLKDRKSCQSGMNIYNIGKGGLAWNEGGLWTVAHSSNQPEYMLSQLKPFFAPEEPIVGEWYYYMGAEKGGLDTEGYWEKGVLAKFRGKRNYDTLSWEFSETTSPNMPHPGSSNKACAFRKATKGELIAAGLMYPLTPEECFSQLTPPPVVPEKWSVRITAETKDTLEAFMRARRDEFVGYEPTWKLTISNGKGYFNYPQSHKNSNATYDFIPQGYKEVELKQILHVLTDKNQTKINLNTEKDGKHIERNTGTTIKVQRPDLSVNRGSTVRATGIRCPGSKITIGSGHSPNQGRSCKG